MSKNKILIVDDEPGIRRTLSQVIEDEGWIADTAVDGEEALRKIEKEKYSIIILDVLLPGKDGIEILREIKSKYKELIVIMISGHSNIEMAVEATKAGAFDFLEKPLSIEKTLLSIKNGLERGKLIKENLLLKQNAKRNLPFIGESHVIRKLKETIEIVAKTNSNVLIFGEKGTGKELIARLLHENSNRRDEKFVKINFAAIPEELTDEELFGYIKGVFPYAINDKIGKLGLADNGTIFFEKIESLNLKGQANLFMALDEKKITPIGGINAVDIDIRIITSTTQDLQKLVLNNRFRRDLFDILGVIPIEVPPLRSRKEDIPLLSEFFIDYFSDEYGIERKYINDNAMRLLVDYHWYGNVSELKNIIERLMILVQKEEISEKDINQFLLQGEINKEEIVTYNYNSYMEAISNFEKEFIRYRLKKNGCDIEKTAKELKIEQKFLSDKIKELQIDIKSEN
jgi:two-component system nitrogen regulation response regulator NtrX